jgi:hypothetical protein
MKPWIYRTLLSALFCGLIPIESARAESFSVKEFLLNNVARNADIFAGGLAETWASKFSSVQANRVVIRAANPNSVPPVQAVERSYPSGSTQTKQKTFNKGLPISATGKNVDKENKDQPGVAYFDDASARDEHVLANSADAAVLVDLRKTVGPRVTVRKKDGSTEQRVLADSVKTSIGLKSSAGALEDGDGVHSADSFAGAEIRAQDTFIIADKDQKPPIVEAIGRNIMTGGNKVSIDTQGLDFIGGVRDPYFVTLSDLDTGTETVEQVMAQDLDWSDALYSMDDTGIRFTINRNDPASFVSLLFTTSMSSWVLNPYTYGARLDSTGLSAFGLTPLSGWTLTTTSDTVEAFFSFGADGQPYDDVMVRPPDSLFTLNHMYTYDVGASNGLFDVVTTTVPEPATLTLVLCGLALVFIPHLYRRVCTRRKDCGGGI